MAGIQLVSDDQTSYLISTSSMTSNSKFYRTIIFVLNIIIKTWKI